MEKKFFSNPVNVVNQPCQCKRLLIWFFALFLIPFLIANLISYLTASNILQADAVQSLNSTSRLKSEYINSFFNERIKDLNHISQLSNTIRLFGDILQEYKKRKDASGETLHDYIESYIFDVFSIEIGLDLETFITTFQYNDIFLLDLEGNIIVTVMGSKMRGVNVFKGKYAHTRFADACREILKNRKPRFSDLETVFDPAGKKVSGFLVQLMMDERKSEEVINKETGQPEKIKKPVGIIAIQIPMEQINKTMKKQMGSWETGETYLIGKDRLMRSGSPSEVLKTRVDTIGAERWENKESGISMYTNYKGQKVLGVNYNLDSLAQLGVSWGILAEINEAEAFGSSRSLLVMNGVIVFSTIFIVFLGAFIAVRRILEPHANYPVSIKATSGDLSNEEIKKKIICAGEEDEK